MESFEKYSQEFEQLILNKEYSLLNKNELQQLDAEGLSEEEYYQIRETLLAIKEMDSEMEFPSEHVKNKLLDVFDEGAQKQVRIIVFPMWAKLTLLAAACIALGLFLFNPNSTIYNTTNEVASNSQSSANEDQVIYNTSSESNTVSTDQTPIIDNTSKETNQVDEIQSSDESISTITNSDNQVGVSEIPMEDAPTAIANSNTSVCQTQPATLTTSSIPTSAFKWTNSLESEKSGDVESNVVVQSVSLADFPNVISQTVTIY
jgi:cytoskeletal protein RodZ